MNLPDRRVVVLGASNVARGLGVVVETACSAWGRPLDILAAIGHGRSYGMTTRVMGRTLPSILDCDLWDEWRSREQRPTAALITDIGNDILYGAYPDQIVDWVRRCFERLADSSERITVTELPLDSVSKLGRRQFRILRSILFPRATISLEDALSRANEVNERVLAIAKEFEAAVVKPDANWFGYDPIHIRPRVVGEAWRQILSPWNGGEPFKPARGSLRESMQWWLTPPKYRKILGVQQRCEQPAARRSDGTLVSLY